MKLKGKRIVMLVGPGYEDLEFWVVYMRMLEEGADIKIVGLKKDEEYISKSGGLKVKSEYRASEVNPDEVDAILIPGGWAPDKLRRDKDILDLIKEVYKSNKIIGMICHAGLVGISAGIVKGKKATGSRGIKDDLENAGAIWEDRAAFRDGNLVWGRVVKDIPYYCRELIKALKESQ
ncbi:MAG: type 1 glutamine amidotransferase [Candidatus Omnitrophota bacterium]|nr:MAG: type 1 glutamine amidotransferase [Candidatus Omnitrophota bacterium]